MEIPICADCNDPVPLDCLSHWTEGSAGDGHGHHGRCCDCFDFSCGKPSELIREKRARAGEPPWNGAKTYRFHVTSDGDGEFAGICEKFPLLSWIEPTPELALAGIKRLVAEVIADMATTGEIPPAP